VVDPVKALQRPKSPPICPNATCGEGGEYRTTRGGYEPGQGSQVANEIYLSGSQPMDVDASQPEKEPDYVPHNLNAQDTGQSIQSIILAVSGFADGDEEEEEMHRVMEEEDEDGLT
jgi:hypothetical protein